MGNGRVEKTRPNISTINFLKNQKGSKTAATVLLLKRTGTAGIQINPAGGRVIVGSLWLLTEGAPLK
jgi:hypothetical protein